MKILCFQWFLVPLVGGVWKQGWSMIQKKRAKWCHRIEFGRKRLPSQFWKAKDQHLLKSSSPSFDGKSGNGSKKREPKKNGLGLVHKNKKTCVVRHPWEIDKDCGLMAFPFPCWCHYLSVTCCFTVLILRSESLWQTHLCIVEVSLIRSRYIEARRQETWWNPMKHQENLFVSASSRVLVGQRSEKSHLSPGCLLYWANVSSASVLKHVGLEDPKRKPFGATFQLASSPRTASPPRPLSSTRRHK